MKKHRLAAAVMLLLCLLICSVTAYASDTELTTTVPTEHTVQLKVDGRGSVVIDGAAYSQNAAIPVKRFSTIDIKVSPAENSALSAALYNDTDVTAQLANGFFTSEAITDNVTITVTFRDTNPQLPQTGNPYRVWAWLLLIAGISCIVIGKKIKNKA